MGYRKNNGFSSIEILCLLFFVGVLSLGAYGLLNQYKIRVSRKAAELKERERFESICDCVLEEIRKDKTNNSDSKFDPFFLLNETNVDDVKIKIRDLSSLINPNFFPFELLDDTNLGTFFESKKPFSSLADQIADRGLIFTYDDIEEYLSPEIFQTYFSPYGIACFNIASRQGFEKLLENVLSNKASSIYLGQKRDELHRNQQMIQNETELKLVYGIALDDIYPYISLNQPMNIHFVEPIVLEAVLSYPKFNIPSWKSKSDLLISLRNSHELSEEDLMNCLGVSKSDPLYYFFGTKTWFWEIELSNDKYTFTTVVFRYPEETLKNEPVFYIINRKWKKNEKKQPVKASLSS